MYLENALELAHQQNVEIYQKSNPDWIYRFDDSGDGKNKYFQHRRKWGTEWSNGQFDPGMFNKNDWMISDETSPKNESILKKLEELKNIIIGK